MAGGDLLTSIVSPETMMHQAEARENLSFVFIFVIALLIVPPASPQSYAATTSATHSGRERLLLDRGWLFHEGDIPFPVVTGHEPSYANAKAGSSSGAASPEFNDSQWRDVDLPHDWAVEQPFDPNANSAQGFRDRGMGWYRKYFRLDPADHGKHLELQFDGIATHCTIWVNGVLSARNWSGYNSIYIDITPIAKFGSEVNTIAVQVDAVAQEGWWYEGAGIYRHVWLVKRDPVHIETDGVFANPTRSNDGKWSIPIEAALYSSDKASANVKVESTLVDPNGKEVTSGTARVTVEPLKEAVAKIQLTVESPKLWSIDEPTLYSVRTVVKRDGMAIDDVATTIGFRTIRFDPDNGFFLNDKPVKLLGTCNHQDAAGVGVAVPDSIWEFRIRRLKEMGSNAYRCAHNAPAAEFLDAADRLGMLVMDENRNFGSSPEHLRQLDWMVRRDRNHPSVILWSVFNEEPSQGTEMGYEMVRRMSEKVKERDTTRPVTAAQSNSVLNPVNASQAADVAGFNYVYRDYDRYHALYPSKPTFSSEDTSTVMTRDEYVTDRAAGVIDSYDDQVMPWGLSNRNAWKEIAERPFVAGTMVWAGFDYRGEIEPLSWPSAGSSYGVMDLCGFPKNAYYIHQAQWITDRPILHLVPHWNWAGSEGKPIKVMVTSNADRVALILNGKSVGEKPVDKYDMATFEVPYEPGKLEAVATTDGKEVARFAVETTGIPSEVRLVPDRTTLAGDGYDAEPVTVEIVDGQGRLVPTADSELKFSVDGPGQIIGVNNGDPRNHESEKGTELSVFHGLAQVTLQTATGGHGKILLRATSAGLKAGEVAIDVAESEPRPYVSVILNPPLTILNWRRSPVMSVRPSHDSITGVDVHGWTETQPGSWLVPYRNGRFAIHRAEFTPRAIVQKSGGTIVLRDVAGKAEVWVDGKLAGEKVDGSRADFKVACPPGDGKRVVEVLIESGGPDIPAGLGGIVTVE
jgi:beta-galactosidase